MTISAREKIGIILLIIVAIGVFIIPGDEELNFNGNEKISKTVLNIIVTKFQGVKPFEIVDRGNSNKDNQGVFVLKRNIFQYGTMQNLNFNNQNQQVENKEETSLKTKSDKNDVSNDKETLSKFPQINFKIIGIIKTENGVKAVVIIKGPELFVVKEGQSFFGKFFVKKVGKKSVILGSPGIDEEKTINLDNKGGF